VRLTGETMTEAVTVDLEQRPDRERTARANEEGLPDRLERVAARLRSRYDTRPVTKEEWDWASGDED
jgi:antitoxin VapB